MRQKENNNLPFSITDFVDLTKPIPFKQSNILFHDENGFLTPPPETYECEHPHHANICKTKGEDKYNTNEMYVMSCDYKIEIRYYTVTYPGQITTRPIIICKKCYEYEISKYYK